MSQPYTNQPTSRVAGQPGAGGLPGVGEMDADLRRTVRRAAYMRQGFYVVVLLVALAGQVSGAVETLHIPLFAAIPAVGALELGGIVVLANADVRRRLGERATASRLLSVLIAAGAVAFNWLAHADHLLGGFFAGMSALGYLVWLMHTENQRRDRLRAKGTLAWTTPAYEVVGHWLAHPWLTRRARALAKADPNLGLYDSLAEARAAVRRERREKAIAKVLHRKIRSAVDPTTADIAVHVYDLEEIAARLADGADYDGLTSLIAADLAPARLAAGRPTGKRRGAPATVDGSLADPALSGTEPVPALPAGTPHDFPLTVSTSDQPHAWTPEVRARANGAHANGGSANGAHANGGSPNGGSANGTRLGGAHADGTSYPDGDHLRGTDWRAGSRTTGVLADVPGPLPVGGAESLWDKEIRPTRRRAAREDTQPVLPDAIKRQVGDLLPRARGSARTAEQPAIAAEPAGPGEPAGPARREGALRRLVHATLDERVPPGDRPDNTKLMALVTDELQLSDLEQASANHYVHSWQQAREVSAS